MKTEPENNFSWSDAISETYRDLSEQAFSYAPNLIGAIVLLLVGWLIAHFLRIGTRKAIFSLDGLFKRVSKSDSTKSEQLKRSYSMVIGQFVFWAIMLFFIAASANLLGWNMFAGWMDSIVVFLPRLIAGLLIVLTGFLTSVVVRSAIASASLGTSNSQRLVLARLAQVTILLSAVIIGVEQIGLNMQFLTNIILVVLGVLLAGACLAFALGAKPMAENAIGAQYSRKHFRVGEYLKIGGFEGEILEIRQTCIVLDTPEGRAIIPAKLFHETVSLLKSSDEPVPEPDVASEDK